MQPKAAIIVHVLHRFAVGGLENGVVNLINNLSEDKYRHAIVAMDGFCPEFVKRLNKNVPIYSVDKRPGKDVLVYWRLWKLLRKINPDIVHTRNLSALEAQLPAFFAGIPARVHSEHGWDVRDPNGDVKKYQRIRRIFGVLVHIEIPLSRQIESYLVGRVGISPKKIVRICNGVDLTRFSGLKGSEPKGALFSTDQFVFGCVGRLEEIKGHKFLAQAFCTLIEKNPEMREVVRLCFVGDGSKRGELESILQQGRVLELCYFSGNSSDVPAMLKQFDCFVLPSLAEGISNTILEAMASSLPVIATNVGGNADLIEDGKTGTLVKKADSEALSAAMVRYIRSQDLARAHGEAGFRRVAANFSLDAMVSQYAEVYDKLLCKRAEFKVVNDN